MNINIESNRKDRPVHINLPPTPSNTEQRVW